MIHNLTIHNKTMNIHASVVFLYMPRRGWCKWKQLTVHQKPCWIVQNGFLLLSLKVNFRCNFFPATPISPGQEFICLFREFVKFLVVGRWILHKYCLYCPGIFRKICRWCQSYFEYFCGCFFIIIHQWCSVKKCSFSSNSQEHGILS